MVTPSWKGYGPSGEVRFSRIPFASFDAARFLGSGFRDGSVDRLEAMVREKNKQLISG